MISLWGASSGSKPNLVLDFIGSETLDPRVTFSRASNATRTNAQGLIAYAPHNLELYSQTFANAFWDKAGGLVTVTDNFTTAPDGTTTAAKWTEAAGTGSHHIHDAAGNFTPVVGQAYTMSMYLKQTETNPDRYVQMVFWLAGFPATAYANFDMQTGAIAFQGAGLTSATITPENNGWYRLSISAVATATGASGWQAAFISNANAARAESYTVTAGSEESYYLWGAQVNLGGLVGYTVTTSAVAYGPRFDFDPVTLAPKGLLIEEARTNLLTYSEQFDNAAWGKTNATITANAITAPDGTVTADKLVENTVNGAHYVTEVIISSNGAYSCSVYAKAGERNNIFLGMSDGATALSGAFFNLSTLAITPSTGGSWSATSNTIQAMGNGWYRCIVTGTRGAGSVTTAQIYPTLNTASVSYTGDGTSGIYIWGAQLEAGAFATSYIPTVASQTTRAAENAVMTGTNFSSWYRQDEGTFLANANIFNTSSVSKTIFHVNNGTELNRIMLNDVASNLGYITIAVGGVEVCNLTPNVTITPNIPHKHSVSYKLNNIVAVTNGSAAAVDSLATIPDVSRLNIGARSSAVNQLNGTISKLAFYPKQLPNIDLQAMTTL